MFGFGKVENTVVNNKCVRALHHIAFHRYVRVVILQVIDVNPLIKIFFFIFQDNVGYQFSIDSF